MLQKKLCYQKNFATNNALLQKRKLCYKKYLIYKRLATKSFATKNECYKKHCYIKIALLQKKRSFATKKLCKKKNFSKLKWGKNPALLQWKIKLCHIKKNFAKYNSKKIIKLCYKNKSFATTKALLLKRSTRGANPQLVYNWLQVLYKLSNIL